MHREYAIDPIILISFDRIRALLGSCGWHKGKVVCEYPKRWKRMVYDACGSVGDRERAQVTEVLKSHPFVQRRNTSCYSPDNPWLHSAKVEHGRRAFTAILSDVTDSSTDVIDGQSVTEDNESSWEQPSGLSPRTATDFADAISMLAQNSNRIAFVDPHFDFSSPRYTEPFTAMLKAIDFGTYKRSTLDNQVPIELHVRVKRGLGSNDPHESIAARLETNMKHQLPRHIPRELVVRIFLWKEHDSLTEDSERLHNRYVLTDLGGMSFGIGLDVPNVGGVDTYQNDDINILTKQQHKKHLGEYCDSSACFDPLGDFEVQGSMAE